MSEMPMPNDAEKSAMSKRLAEVANIIRNGVFAGAYSGAVAAALQWLDQGASFYNVPDAPPAGAQGQAPEAPAPDLKVVPDEQK